MGKARLVFVTFAAAGTTVAFLYGSLELAPLISSLLSETVRIQWVRVADQIDPELVLIIVIVMALAPPLTQLLPTEE